MNKFDRLNTIIGWCIFLLATLVYTACMEPTVSFWDCGEFIAAAFKMEVGHQPGAPLFLMIGKLFSLLAGSDTGRVAYWINFLSVVASAATVMFLFWTITAIALKTGKKAKHELNRIQMCCILLAGILGALAYTFSDTFWFSAVEAEVYALSTLCTAIVFWAILKWEKEMNDKWLIFIAYMIGLSISIHLLSLLVLPAIALIYYFRKSPQVTLTGTAKAFLAGCLLLGIIQFGVIQYFVRWAAETDFFFVNTLGMGFGSGALSFLFLVAVLIGYGIFYSIRKRKYQMNLGLICLTFILLGFSSYFMIIIRANAKPGINLSNPDTPLSLFSYLSREQYGDKPLLYGQFYNSKPVDIQETGKVYRKGTAQYEFSRKDYKRIYDKNILFPRMYSDRDQHIAFYRNWMNLGENETPTFLQNLKFFTSYQLGFMYWRYFAWNFIGRQNDIQGHGSLTEGNWMSGLKPLDTLHLGNQSQLPPSIVENKGHNLFYGLPCLLGLIGLLYLWRKDRNQALTLMTLFVCTGMAIIVYINQDPMQVRERDYAYVGSFYAFAIFIGLSIPALYNWLSRYRYQKLSLALVSIAGFAAPVFMAVYGWDDHDRSQKITALEMAKNYLNSCEPNAILFTNADNDTYPLWYAQEVEGIRTDVRVVNLQFLSSEAYIDQMKRPQYQSAALPIRMKTGQYKDGTRDYLSYYDYGIKDSVELGELFEVLTSDHKEDKIQMQDGSFENFLPTRKFKMTIHPDQIIATKTVDAADRDKIAAVMEWEFKKPYVLKSDLAMFDILVHNHWKRPVYFSASVSEDTYIGLDKYLYLEGYAYRLLPLKPSNDENFTKTAQTNDIPAARHFVKQFEMAGFKKASYLDPESRRVMQGTLTFSNTLTGNLIRNNRQELARQVMKRTLEALPLDNSTISDTLNKVGLIDNLYQLKDISMANRISRNTVSCIGKELDYVLSLRPEQQQSLLNDIRIGFYVLQQLHQLATQQRQYEITNHITDRIKLYETAFAKNFG